MSTPSAPLLTVKIPQGTVTVTTESVTLQRRGPLPRVDTFRRATIVQVDERWTIPPIFGMGGQKEMTLRFQDGSHFALKTLTPSQAKQLAEVLRP